MAGYKQILDPVSTLCKLAMLEFCDIGSKLSISGNIIEIQKTGSAQWAIRKYRGDGKAQIFLLHNPIIKAIEWYILEPSLAQTKETTDSIINIMGYAIGGLEKLKKTYKESDTDGNVILSIQFLINNLKLVTKNKFSPELFRLFNGLEAVGESSHILNYEKIKGIWNPDTIGNISAQLTLCEKNLLNITDIDFMLDSLGLMLKNTDSKFKKLVNDMNSTL